MSKRTSIGWKTTLAQCALKQGSSGIVRVGLVVTEDDGSPLPTYTGWLAALALYTKEGRRHVVTLDPIVQGDAETMTLTIDIPFAPEHTSRVAPGRLQGDLRLAAPDGARHVPVSFDVDLDRLHAVLS